MSNKSDIKMYVTGCGGADAVAVANDTEGWELAPRPHVEVR
jgi:hypothetical protein